MSHLLVTNDFPPKVGGIQSYIWELWRRLPEGECTVLTTPHPQSGAFDDAAPMRIERTRERVLLPTPHLVRQVRDLCDETGARLVVLDPALPLGLIGPRLHAPYAVVLHGAEVTVPGRIPFSRELLAGVLRRSSGIIAAGPYPESEALRAMSRSMIGATRASVHRDFEAKCRVVPPGVDTERFTPPSDTERNAERARLGVDPEGELVVSVSRLVPRKGMDTLIRAASILGSRRPKLTVVIGGTGRDADRLKKMARELRAPVRILGRVLDDDLARIYGAADLFVMACRDRWGGLEQEGFGIVFLEAAACGVPQIAGHSGGSADAVDDGVTGIVLAPGAGPDELVRTMDSLLDDPVRRVTMGMAARRRAEQEFGYDHLAGALAAALQDFGA